MLSSRLARTGTALLLFAVVLVVLSAGCARTPEKTGGTAQQSQSASGAADASPALPGTGSAEGTIGTALPKSQGGASKPTGKPLSSSDAEAIDAELSAIQKELDSMALPGDSDFGGIESGLE